jgi:alkanesulfonate monooxygenase SsuD/methylene tetrahydromethanopterin reductase-like flavin-dependent oxidoreductase (luciferase family)
MKFGSHILPTYMPELDGQLPDFYRCMFEQIVEVEKLGFDHAWVTEHHFGGYGGTLPHPPTFLSAVAQRTSRIRLGVAVAVLPLHRPIDLAEQYAMADVVSNGRIDFAIGKGSAPVEYRKFGADQGEATARFHESAEVIRQAWSDQPINFRGAFYHYENVNILPKPVQRPHPPIWVGATRTEETFRWAGEQGYDLMTVPFVHPSTGALRDLVKIYRDALARSGNDFVGRQVLGKFHIYVSDSFERGMREAAPTAIFITKSIPVASSPSATSVRTWRPALLSSATRTGAPIRSNVGMKTPASRRFPARFTSATCRKNWRSKTFAYSPSESCQP